MELMKILVLLATFATAAKTSNILALLGCPSKSHHIWFSALLRGLAANGHNLTVVSTDIDQNPPDNIHYIQLDGVYNFIYENLDLNMTYTYSIEENVAILYKYSLASCLGIKQSKGLQQLLNYPDDFQFDLVIYDYTSGPCILGFLHKFNYPPLISMTAYNNPSYTAEIVGGHNYPAYIPYCALDFDTDMNFGQRLLNLYVHLYDFFYRKYMFLPAINAMVKPVFAKDSPNVSDLELRTTVVLVNVDPAIGYPEPLPPNVIPVAGMQIVEPKPLPKDIELFIRASSKGVILFSLGSNLKSSDMAAEKLIILLKAFAKMPEYHFLWKFETENLPIPLPVNVMVKKWLSQNDILAHNHTKAFITHSGTLSTHEAMWYGVPMVTIPFFFDQLRNSRHAIRAGVAESIAFDQLSVELVVEQVLKVCEDPSYQRNAKIRSKSFQDQPEKPLARALWWTEYVMRNPQPDHLRSPVLNLGSFAANMYDIFLLVLVTLAIVIYLVFKILKALLVLTKRHGKIKQQ